MSRICSGLLSLLVLAGCSVHVGGGGDGGGAARAPRASIDTFQYSRLMAMDDRILRQRAQIGDLGNCEVRNVGYQSGGCYSESSYALFLSHKGVYYPAMSAEAYGSAACLSSIDQEVKRALREGFCYGHPTVLSDLDATALKRRAQAGELGNCEVRDIGYQSGGCYSAHSFAVFLRHKGVFFPSMSADASGSAVCESSVGENVQQAFRGGFCY